MVQLEGWFQSWVPSSVFSAGGGRSSLAAWYTTALDIEEVVSGVVSIFSLLLSSNLSILLIGVSSMRC